MIKEIKLKSKKRIYTKEGDEIERRVFEFVDDSLKRGKRNKTIELSLGEIDTLILLVKQRLLRLEQMYEYLNSTGKCFLMFSSYRARVFKRYCNLGLVVPETKIIAGSNKFNYYRIGPYGLRLLVENNFLPQQFSKIDIKQHGKTKQLDHYLATQDLVISGISVGLKSGIEIDSYSAKENPTFSKSELGQAIQPDWILKKGNHFINIETDMGKEKHSIILSKIKRYGELANENPENQYTIIFSLIDEAYRVGNESHKQRVGKIKQMLVTQPELQIKNLVIYVLKYSRAMKLIGEIVKGDLPYQKYLEEINVETVANALTVANKKFAYSFHKLDTEEFLSMKSYGDLSTIRIYEVSNKAGNKHYTLFTFMEEGRVNHLDRLRYLHSMVKEGKTKKPVKHLVAIYPYQEGLEHDLLGQKFNGVIFGNANALTKLQDKEPEFLKTITLEKMKVVSYEG